ncbi:MAG: acyl-ACP--UDP-N-acetylglucosamine O-acyltransferase [Simkaniaceae bacterium]|nr:acyl-ACP--UDP-N-acetylglucosamine O-acyltransferase [Simkaniaceae bacterium]
MDKIHPTAIVEEGAVIGKDVVLEPYAIVKKNVTLGDRVTIKSHAYIDGHTTIGDDTTIYPCASIGTKTQALNYNGETTYVQIGKNCEIREYVTINSSSEEGTVVSVGDNSLIMAYCHLAHHCTVGKYVIMSNSSMLAGHVTVEDFAVIGGMTPVHQNVRIGAHSMVGGFSRVTHDIPPYTIGAGYEYRLGGLNLIGLKRRGFSLETRTALSKAYKLTFRSGLPLDEALARIADEFELLPEITHWIDFCKNTDRGFPSAKGEKEKEFAGAK